MPPLIIFMVGIIATILFMTVSVWLAVVIVLALVFTCLFRIRHLGRSQRPGGMPPADASSGLFFWMNANPPGAPPHPGDQPGQQPHGHHHHGHHHHPTPDAAGGHAHHHHHHDSSSFSGGDGGGHHGGHH